MSAYSDNGLARILKNWVAEKQPPADGRARLLAQAVKEQRKRYDLCALIPRNQFNDYPIQYNNEWSQTIFSWFFAQSINAGVRARA